MLDQGFEFWFTDREEMRSPFPEYMHDELRDKTSQRFSEWLDTLGKVGAAKLEGNELVEMFEMFLFNVGMSLTSDSDQQITITYPFMPRCGDEVDDAKHGLSNVTHREVLEKQEEKRQLKLVLKTQAENKTWETEFDLPA